MATTITAATEGPPQAQRFAADATADDALQITIKAACKHVELWVVNSSDEPVDFKYSHTGTDSSALAATTRAPFVAGQKLVLDNGPRGHDNADYDIYVSAGEASCQIVVMVSPTSHLR